MFYEKNFKFISTKFPFLLKELNNISKKTDLDIEVIKSKNGKPVTRVVKNGRQIFLNSAYDPEMEAGRWAERHAVNEKSTLFIFGGGFLYHLKAILKKGSYQKVVCYEPCPELLKKCLQNIDLSEFKNYDFLIVTGNNFIEVAGQINQYLSVAILEHQIEILPYYQELFTEQISRIQYVLWESIRISRLNLATSKMAGSQWLANGAFNSHTIINSPGIRNFFDKFKGIPAVIVSAGPSLVKNIHLLNNIRENAVIICAGTSIRAMQKFEVLPHFLVAFDGAPCNTEIFSNLELKDICLIYSYRFFPKALQQFTGKKVYMKLDTDTFSDYLSLKCGGYDFGTIRSGFSVAHSALDVAMKMGCEPVIMIGQDLAFTGNRNYAENLKMITFDNNNLPPGSFYTKDIDGKDIVTDQKLDSMRLLFELMAAEYYQGKTIINATEGGQPIKGISNRKLAEVINEYCQTAKNITGQIDYIYNSGFQEIKRHASQAISNIREIRSLAIHEFFHMESLVTQIDQARKLLFFEGFEFDKLELLLTKTAAEFQGFLSRREWQLIMKDVIDSKINPNQIAIELMGEIRNEEYYCTKLQYWLNILTETSRHLRLLIGPIARLLNSISNDENDVVSITKIANTETWQQYEEKIRKGRKLDEIKAQLVSIIKQGSRTDINEYQYLYGVVLYKTGQYEKAFDTIYLLAVKNNNFAKAYFLGFRIIRQFHNVTMIKNYLKKCLESNYKTKYCQKMLINTAFLAKEYMVTNNYLTEFENELRPRSFYTAIKIACLTAMKLYGEAEVVYENLIKNYRIRPSIRKRLTELLINREETDYEKVYQSNIAFFKDKGIEFKDYTQAGYKLCRFLGEEYIFDSQQKRFIPIPDETENDTLEIVAEDTLMICDTDNVKLYEQLQEYLKKDISETDRQKILLTPIIVVEHQAEHWQLLMQRFDFNKLNEWRNLHFLIGIDNQRLERIYQDVSLPLPNVLYGTDLVEIKELLDKIKKERDISYQQDKDILKDYYQQRIDGLPQKIMVVVSITNPIILKYGQALVKFITEQGYECRLEHENAPYYKFSKYTDLKLLDQFRPDLVVHLFALQEELEAYKDLDLPFIYWRILDRPLTKITTVCHLEKVLVHGDQKFKSDLINKGFQVVQIREIPLPYLPGMGEGVVENGKEKGIQVAINADIKDPEPIISNIATIVFGMLSGRNITKQNVVSVINTIYFRLYSHFLNLDSILQEDKLYNEIINEELDKCNLEIGKQMVDLIASLFRREMEDTLMNLTQVSWLLNSKGDYKIELFGKGWEKITSFKDCFQGYLEPLSDRYQQAVLESKINIYTNLSYKNGSYMQPDLINGIAAGGFFLVNGCLVNDTVVPTAGLFQELLETYSTKEELLSKVEYFLKNENIRRKRSEQLSDLVREKFKFENIKLV